MDEYDPFRLERFVAAQEGTYSRALAELRAGRKRSHWMWFVFPQVAGLGRSPTAVFYSIKSRGEAEAYLAHAVLGCRLRACVTTLLTIEGASAAAVFGSPDDLKFCSSMTLFDHVAPGDTLFEQAIGKFCAGRRDAQTLEILKETMD